MAMTAAERQRRSRARSQAHSSGNHALCDPLKCRGDLTVTRTVTPDVTVTPRQSPPGESVTVPESTVTTQDPLPFEDSGRVPGGIETMARAFVDALPFATSDPRRMVGELAVALARRVDEDGAAAPVVKELRTLLMQIAEVPDQDAGPVDAIRYHRAQRRFDTILAGVEKGMILPPIDLAG